MLLPATDFLPLYRKGRKRRKIVKLVAAQEFNPERVEKFGSVDEAEGRGFVRLSDMEVDE